MFGNIFNQLTPGQLYHLKLEGGQTVLAEPLEKFSSAVFYYWLMFIDGDEVFLDVVPDAALDLVVSPLNPKFSAIYPPVIKKLTIPLYGPDCYAGISFESEAAQQYFKQDLEFLSALESGTTTTEALNLEELTADIQNVTDILQVKNIFDRYLNIRNLKPVHRLRRSAYQCFVEELGSGSLRSVAQRIGVSERQFRRTIHDISGLPPKHVQRIVRVQQLIHGILNAERNKSEDGFYDDSHRIRELKILTGISKSELQKMAEIYNK